MSEKSGIAKRREEIRKEHWPNESLWTGEKEKGWFPVPRSLPLVLALLKSKQISGKKDPSSVYLELLSRQRGEGVIEMMHENDHAFAAGYEGTRAVRTWQERMKVLEANGFIQTKQVGNQRYKYVPLFIRRQQCNVSVTKGRFQTIGGMPITPASAKPKKRHTSSAKKRKSTQRNSLLSIQS